MRGLICALAAFTGALAGAEPAPEFYKRVSRLTWVVRDIGRAPAAWGRLTGAHTGPVEETELYMDVRGVASTSVVRWARGRIGQVDVDWIQPVSGKNAYAEFLEKRGEGIFSLMHRAPTRADYLLEAYRIGRMNIATLQRGVYQIGGNLLTFSFFDTQAAGGYVLGIYHESQPAPDAGLAGARITQYAFVVKDFQPVSDFWSKFGLPAFKITETRPRDMQYRGKPAAYALAQGWQRHGDVAYEWMTPPAQRSVYHEFLDTHGEGVQHLGIGVADMDAAIAERKAFVNIQSGAWGEAGKPGSGRFAYLDADGAGGVLLELLWSFK